MQKLRGSWNSRTSRGKKKKNWCNGSGACALSQGAGPPPRGGASAEAWSPLPPTQGTWATWGSARPGLPQSLMREAARGPWLRTPNLEHLWGAPKGSTPPPSSVARRPRETVCERGDSRPSPRGLSPQGCLQLFSSSPSGSAPKGLMLPAHGRSRPHAFCPVSKATANIRNSMPDTYAI